MPSTTSSCASKRSWVTKQFLQERPGANQSGWQHVIFSSFAICVWKIGSFLGALG